MKTKVEIIPNIGKNFKGVIKLTFPQRTNRHTGLKGDADILFDGVKLWRNYVIISQKNGVIFGVVHSIGNRMNAWATENYYIAVRLKDKKILGANRREMGWHGSHGMLVADWKRSILEGEAI
jgi:hypothetical protein